MIQEVIVVEGKSDIARVSRAVDADLIATEGFVLRPETVQAIRDAYERRGIIILTDPDGAGERIRRYLSARFPQALHAFVPKEEATAHDDVGIEQASPESIRRALAKVRPHQQEERCEFTGADLRKAGLVSTKAASARRARIGARLGIGYGNAKRMLSRLNRYGVTRAEWEQALTEEADGN